MTDKPNTNTQRMLEGLRPMLDAASTSVLPPDFEGYDTLQVGRTLGEIVELVRIGGQPSRSELVYAVVAFDVLMSQLHVDKHFDQLQEYLKASHTPPQEYAGWVNDPVNPEAVAWYKAMLSVSAGGAANDDA